MSRSRGFGIVLACALAIAPSLAHAKKKKKDAGGGNDATKGDFQPEAAPTGDEPSKTLDRALKLYDTDDFFSASIELNKVVEGESGDSEANKQKAEFWMGKALYNMKFYSASLSFFDRIVQKGASHAYYNATLKWLASLSRQLPDSTGILEKIGKFQKSDLEQPRRPGSARPGEGARRALLPAGQVLLPEGAVQGGRRALQRRPLEQ
jgi:hypothetical protein